MTLTANGANSIKSQQDSHTFTLAHVYYMSKRRQGRKAASRNLFGGGTERDSNRDDTLLPIVHPEDLIPFVMIFKHLNRDF